MTLTALHHHWLADMAQGIRLPGATTIDLPPDAAIADAWEHVRVACGLTDTELTECVARHFHLHLAGLETAEAWTAQLLPERLARKYHVMPLRGDDRRLVVATSNPADIEAEQTIGFVAGRTPVFEVASPAVLQRAIDDRYAPELVVETLLDRVASEASDTVALVAEELPENVGPGEVEATPVVRLTNLIIHDAIEQEASDIHLEPSRAGGTVRFRVDGLLRTHMHMPLPALTRVVSRLKIMCRLDIADRVRPQDGRCRVKVSGRAYDFRLSTVPMRSGEKAVIRILDAEGARRLADLQLTDEDLRDFQELLKSADGIVVVTGPTGAGKTTTLYAALQQLATGEMNIMTVEDPVEYELPGMNQIQIAPKQGITFATSLRAILRQDPDVIFIGEIRDLDTARIAVQAALTGHFVLATVHANDAPSVVARLADIGLDRASIANALRGAVAQQLVRRICRHCATPVQEPLTPDETRLVAQFGTRPTVRATGCDACAHTGYRGRMPILQIWANNPEYARMIGSGASSYDLQRAATDNGHRRLIDGALDRVRRGETTLEEVERVLGVEVSAEAATTAKPVVLIADDDPVIRATASAVLRKHGFETTEVADGEAALERLQSGPDVSLLVLDLDMPRMDGRTALARLRGSLRTAGLPVIVLTGLDDPETELSVMDAGADDFIRKPLDPPRFLARVRATLRRASG